MRTHSFATDDASRSPGCCGPCSRASRAPSAATRSAGYLIITIIILLLIIII